MFMSKWQCSSEVVFHYRNGKYNVLHVACRNSGKISFCLYFERITATQTSWHIIFFIYRAENEKSLSSDTSSTDVKSFFSNSNVAALRQLGGGRVLLDLCLSLPEFSKIITSQPAPSSSLMSLTSSRWAV